ncbi:hypothetical protein [Burkholderia ambifaria]|uniref:hypothetical protein n=1 Tax=Burkholderia ambifaria TaxID=152480 RepID=UPI00158885E1|nr:hypothetical protein [Burkholderia ambifaria]
MFDFPIRVNPKSLHNLSHRKTRPHKQNLGTVDVDEQRWASFLKKTGGSELGLPVATGS